MKEFPTIREFLGLSPEATEEEIVRKIKKLDEKRRGVLGLSVDATRQEINTVLERWTKARGGTRTRRKRHLLWRHHGLR